MGLEALHHPGREPLVVQLPAHEVGVVVSAATEALAVQPAFLGGIPAADTVDGPGVIVPVDRADEGEVGFG